MILSNQAICDAIRDGLIVIDPAPELNPSAAHFDTTALDLRLGKTIVVPIDEVPAAHDLRRRYSAEYISRNSNRVVIRDDAPYPLKPQQLVLGQTLERVSLPIAEGRACFSARVEGKSSRARIGLVVHLTAPTVHAGFYGHITLEMVNLGNADILLYPGVSICQLIFEQVSSSPVTAPNQFLGQNSPEGISSS